MCRPSSFVIRNLLFYLPDYKPISPTQQGQAGVRWFGVVKAEGEGVTAVGQCFGQRNGVPVAELLACPPVAGGPQAASWDVVACGQWGFALFAEVQKCRVVSLEIGRDLPDQLHLNRLSTLHYLGRHELHPLPFGQNIWVG